jgi:Allinase
MRHATESAVLLSGWHRMSYQTTDKFMSLELEKHIRRLHALVGNAITQDKYLVFGSGSTQLLNALVYALSPDNTSSPASVVATAPYYRVLNYLIFWDVLNFCNYLYVPILTCKRLYTIYIVCSHIIPFKK